MYYFFFFLLILIMINSGFEAEQKSSSQMLVDSESIKSLNYLGSLGVWEMYRVGVIRRLRRNGWRNLSFFHYNIPAFENGIRIFPVCMWKYISRALFLETGYNSDSVFFFFLLLLSLPRCFISIPESALRRDLSYWRRYRDKRLPVIWNTHGIRDCIHWGLREWHF